MRAAPSVHKEKGLTRALNRQATDDGKAIRAEGRTGRLSEPKVCERCGAVFSRRTWRRDHSVDEALLDQAVWVTCPACAQVDADEYCGRVLISGSSAIAQAAAIRRRITNVEARAQFNQPERRVVSNAPQGDGFEVLTTSQKLAHRIVRELKKAFGGEAEYKWSDDGSLFARWHWD